MLIAAFLLLCLLMFALRVLAAPIPSSAPSEPSGAASAVASPLNATPGMGIGPNASPGTRLPLTPSSANRSLILRADRVTHVGERTIARGHAVAITESAYIEGDEIEIDHRNNIIYARRNVTVRMNGDEIHCEAMTYDIKSGVADLQDAYGIAKNVTLYHDPIEDALYFWARRIRWDGKVMRLIKATLTTCDLPLKKQHYFITGNVINIYPGDRMEIRKARFYYKNKEILGRELLVLQLHPRRRPNFVPQPGYNTQYGAYIKENFSFALGPQTYGRIFADLYQKNGIGKGLELTYTPTSRILGNFSYYDLAAPAKLHNGMYELFDRTVFLLSKSLSAVVEYEGDRFDSTNPQIFTPTSRFVGLALNDIGPRHFLSMFAQLVGLSPTNDNGFVTSNYYGISYKQRITDYLRNDLEVGYQQTLVGPISSYFVHALDRLTYSASLFDTNVLLEKTSFTGESIFLVNRLPEVVLNSHILSLGPLPVQLSFSAGRLQEEPSGANVGRLQTTLQVPDTYLPLGDNGSVLFGAGFRQMNYDNGDAQYEGAVRADVIEDFDSHWRSHIDYRWQQANGFAPIQSDFFGQYNSLSAGLDFHDRDWLRLSVDGGYDFLFDRSYDVIARMMVQPYRDFRVDVGTTYSIQSHEPTQVDTRVKIPLASNLSMQYWNLYDLIDQKTTYQDFMLQHESHDFLTSLIYRGVQKEIYLQISIKNFPHNVPVIGPNDSQPVLTRINARGFQPDTVTPTTIPTPPR